MREREKSVCVCFWYSQFMDVQKLAAFLDEVKFQHPDSRGLDIGQYLLKPVQRVCKYPLILGELLKVCLCVCVCVRVCVCVYGCVALTLLHPRHEVVVLV